ncbi:MAG: hypothetical protein U9N14_05380, partial [Pseudomonadota bacterium]|nr:hypothetical protein [Pseudomonadota bacterium]
MTRNGEDISTIEATLIAAGDLAYDWDLKTDQINWLGDSVHVFSSGEKNTVATGKDFHARINPQDLPE